MTKHRWICALCNKGALGSSRPRRDDIVRFCLPCSKKTGRLVERSCPVLNGKREKKAALRKETQSKQKEKHDADPRVRATKIFNQLRKLKAWPRALDDVTVRVVRARSGGHSGYAYTYRRHVSLRVVDDDSKISQLVLHELAHMACPNEEHHGDIFRAVLTDAAREALGEHFVLDSSQLDSVYDGLDIAVREGFRRKFKSEMRRKIWVSRDTNGLVGYWSERPQWLPDSGIWVGSIGTVADPPPYDTSKPPPGAVRLVEVSP